MASPTGLALECRHPGTVRASCASANYPLTDDSPPQVHKLEHCLSALEEERRKIGAFLRELPLCMQLLQDAIEAYTEQLTLCKPSPQNWHHAQGTWSFNNTDCNLESSRERALMEEFIPAKRPAGLLQDGEGKLPRKMICKPNWVKQCGILEVEANSHNQERCLINLTIERGSLSDTQENAVSTLSKPYFHSKNKSGGAFIPFSRNKQVLQCTPRLGTLELTDLVPTPSDQGGHVGQSAKLGRVQLTHNGQHHTKEVVVKTAVQGASGPHKSRLARKARRCWSTELHYRFVNALQQLGGSQVATPKQIRELMKVEGLTNDEVKSHLQKYRLHTQRPRATQVEPTQPASELVMLDGIWVPSDCMARPNGYQTSSGLYSQQPTSSQELGSELQHTHHHHHHNLYATSCL